MHSRHAGDDRSIHGPEAAFLRREGSPTGSGHAGVDRADGPLTLDDVPSAMMARFELAPR